MGSTPCLLYTILCVVFEARVINLCDRDIATDTIQARSNSDFDVKCATIQFYGNSHNSQSYNWIGLKFYMESPDMFAYLGLKYHVNRSSARHPNTGQQRLYMFCYLLPFPKKDVGAYFGNLLILQRSLMGCNIVSKCGKDS